MPQLKAIRKNDLIRLLQELPDNPMVGFTYPSGDHWHTQLFASPTGESAEEFVKYTDYHRCWCLVTEDGEAEEAGTEAVVILNCN